MRKKKNVACFGLGRDQYPFVKEMSKDFIIHGFDINRNCYAKKLVDYFYNTPYSKKDKILYLLKKKNISQILSFATEAPINLIGYLNTKLKIKGNKYSVTSKISNKLKYRKILKRFKLKQPPFYEKLNKDIIKKKIITKPKYGSGSENIFFVKNIESLSKHNYFEEFIENGEMFALDGFCIKRKFIPIALSKKNKYKDNVFIDKTIEFNFQNYPILDKASKIVQKHCNIFKIENSPIHFEFLIKDQNFFSIDFHLRGPGSRIYSYLINKLIKPSPYQIQKSDENIKNLKINKNFYCYIFFINNIYELKYIKKIIKNSNLLFKFINFRKRELKESNLESTRSRVGAYYFIFNNKIDFEKKSKYLNNKFKESCFI